MNRRKSALKGTASKARCYAAQDKLVPSDGRPETELAPHGSRPGPLRPLLLGLGNGGWQRSTVIVPCSSASRRFGESASRDVHLKEISGHAFADVNRLYRRAIQPVFAAPRRLFVRPRAFASNLHPLDAESSHTLLSWSHVLGDERRGTLPHLCQDSVHPTRSREMIRRKGNSCGTSTETPRYRFDTGESMPIEHPRPPQPMSPGSQREDTIRRQPQDHPD